MLNYILRPIKEAFHGLFRHFSMTFSSVIAVSVTLVLVSLFLMLTVNLQEITSTVEGKIQIHVQISNDVTEVQTLQTKIEDIEGVDLVTYSSKDEELDKFIASYGKEGLIFEMYRGENNPLKNAFIVELSDSSKLESVGTSISATPGVEKANYGGTNTVKLVNMLTNIRDGGMALVLALGLLALILIINTIKITIQSRSREISIMRTIGATNNFIRAPFVFEGIFIGFIGSILPIGLSIYGYHYAYTALGGVLFTEIFPLRAVFPFVLQLSYLLVMLGITLGLFGSFISVTRYLRGVR